MKTDTKDRLSTTTIALHWVVALFMIGLLGTGIYMEDNEVYSLYSWHKSFGLLIAVFVVWRIIWRIRNGWPEHVAHYTNIEVMLSKLIHYVLIIGTVLMPLSGLLLTVMGGHDLPFFGIEILADNIDPNNPEESLPRNEFIYEVAAEVHDIGGGLIIGTLALHIIGALKHHIVDKDKTLKRMLGQ